MIGLQIINNDDEHSYEKNHEKGIIIARILTNIFGFIPVYFLLLLFIFLFFIILQTISFSVLLFFIVLILTLEISDLYNKNKIYFTLLIIFLLFITIEIILKF